MTIDIQRPGTPVAINTAQTVLPSISRTSSVNSLDIKNLQGKGAHFVIDVSDLTGSPFIIVSIQGKDPASGNYYDILVSVVINAIDTFILRVYPGVNNEPGINVSDVIPVTFRIGVFHGNGDSITYSIAALLVV